jgi:hypothetical protein
MWKLWKWSPEVADTKLWTTGCGIAELQLQSCISFQKCWIVIAEVRPPSCRIADLKKSCTCTLLIIGTINPNKDGWGRIWLPKLWTDTTKNGLGGGGGWLMNWVGCSSKNGFGFWGFFGEPGAPAPRSKVQMISNEYQRWASSIYCKSAHPQLHNIADNKIGCGVAD